MHVLIIADRIFASRERDLLRRLRVGLVDEGVRVSYAVPARSAHLIEESALSMTYTYLDTGLIPTRSARAAELATKLRADAEEESDDIDIVHAFGGSSWAFGADLSRQVECGLVLDIWRARLTGKARGQRAGVGAPVFLAPDVGIERQLIQAVPGVKVRIVPWGVHVLSSPREIARPDRRPGILMVGGGYDRRAMQDALAGIAPCLSPADALLFVDADVAHRAGLWHLAGNMQIQDRVSLIGDLESRRDLAMRCDLVVQPEALSEQRTIVLEAMGSGMAAVAAADPDASYLIDGKTCVLLPEPTRDAWGSAVGSLLGDPVGMQALGESARRWIKAERRVSSFVAGVLDTYEWMTAKQPIPISQGR